MNTLEAIVQKLIRPSSQSKHGRDSSSQAPQRTGQVFLLGAGFSCAANSTMPTMRTLMDSLKRTSDEERWPAAISTDLPGAHDLESWLDSLAVAQPYRTDVENAEAAGLFRRVTAWLGDYLSDIQWKSFGERLPALAHKTSHSLAEHAVHSHHYELRHNHRALC